MKRYLALLACALLSLQALGAKNASMVTVKPSVKGAKSTFAIFADSLTYERCGAEINAYRDVLQSEDLGTYIYAANWNSPEEIKELIKSAYRKNRLEGAVFIGDVPVVRVSGAQHMTTAFKMNEKTFPRNQSWVTTDRFYEDFDLDFRFVERDSADASVFYYHLTEKGAQRLTQDIYSARMVVPDILGGDKYARLSDYLREVVRAHQEENYLDNVIFFAGSGYNFDCLSLWRQKPLAWREYFPLAFDSATTNRFYNFRYGHDVKYQLLDELQRPDTDLFQFSEHGAEDTQYISNRPDPETLDELFGKLGYELRGIYDYYYRGTGNEQEFLDQVKADYNVGPEMFADSLFARDAAYDSTMEEITNIHSKDLVNLHSNPRVLIFNACYNGSFQRRADYIAGCHIFGGGRSIVAQGNTVNVLQDKYEDELMGMLNLGYRVGQWQMMLPYLESHLIGDPTYRFARKETGADAAALETLALRQKTEKALAKGVSCSAQLLDTFKSSGSLQVRLEALHCLSFFADENFVQALMLAFHDPYERIQRMACIYAGDNGDPRLEEGLDWIVKTQDQNVRVQYVASDALRSYESHKAELEEHLSPALDKNAPLKKRISAIRMLRNAPQHYNLSKYVDVVLDSSEDDEVRICMAEALGWCNRSWQRGVVADGFKAARSRKFACSDALREEMLKTLGRLAPEAEK